MTVLARPAAAPRAAAPPLTRSGPRRAAALAVAAIVAAYGWLLAPQLDKPFVYDDVNFAFGARAIARTGLPYGNQGYLLHLYEQREQWALWHPPLYLYALGLTMALFGTSEAAARGLGVACHLAAAGLAFDLARRVARGAPEGQRGGAGVDLAAGVLAVGLFLLNPLTVQSALVLDIDNTVLLLLTTLWAWLGVRLAGRWPPRTIAALGLLYAFTLWAKLTTPLVILAALGFTRGFGPTGRRGALEALAVGLLGWAGFLLSWLLVTGLTGMPVDYTFEVVYREAVHGGISTGDRLGSWPAFVDGAAPAVLWLGPFFGLLFVASGLPALWRLLRGRGLVAGDLVVVLGAAIYLAYIVKLAGGFPKYHAALLPLWAAAGGAFVASRAGPVGPARLAVALAGAAAAFGWLATHAALWEPRLSPELVRLLVVVPLLVGLAIAALWAQLGRRNLIRALPIGLAALTLAWSLALNLQHRDLGVSTAYYYGRHGQRAAAEALAERLGPDELYVASKEVAWYSPNQRYVDQESWQHVVWDLGRGFDGTWLGRPIRLLALEVGEPAHRAEYERLLLPRYRAIGEYGSFLLLERAP